MTVCAHIQHILEVSLLKIMMLITCRWGSVGHLYMELMLDHFLQSNRSFQQRSLKEKVFSNSRDFIQLRWVVHLICARCSYSISPLLIQEAIEWRLYRFWDSGYPPCGTAMPMDHWSSHCRNLLLHSYWSVYSPINSCHHHIGLDCVVCLLAQVKPC